jgi:HSP20 family molecular chaperone IbpA
MNTIAVYDMFDVVRGLRPLADVFDSGLTHLKRSAVHRTRHHRDVLRVDDAGMHIDVIMPGINKADVEVTVEDGVLHVRRTLGDERVVCYTCDIGHGYDDDKTSASMADGILHIDVPRAQVDVLRIDVK